MNHTFRAFRTLTSEETRRVACPVCSAPPGSPCSDQTSGARREHHHAERVIAARRSATVQRTSGGIVAEAIRRRVANKLLKP